MKGLHLFHFIFSNCSQRVRLALAEKSLPWTSHHLDLSRNEHITPEYQEINPAGVVPTLVHDGLVITESNDILQYLEEVFPLNPLMPKDVEKRDRAVTAIHLAGKAQSSIKVLTFDRLFRPFRVIDEDEMEFLKRNHSNTDVIAFSEIYSKNDVEWRERVLAAECELREMVVELERQLEKQPWLSGADYGLADISWIVNVHRLKQADFEFEKSSSLEAWYRKVTALQTFKKAVSEYQEPGDGRVSAGLISSTRSGS